ncbi:MAG: DUF448 domain-containing protein [Myxococcota bacterium]|nr:DUF448 domain-containing protein [Myxococcota bacterium]
MLAPRETESETTPERTCAGCRRRDARSALLRFAVRDVDPRLVPDPRRRLPGRGVSVHPTRACVTKAVEKGGFARALKSKLALDTDTLCAMAIGQYERRVQGLLMAASRTKVAVVGTDAVRRALGAGQVHTLLVAQDAAGRRDEIVAQATRIGSRAVVFGTKSELGRLFGRPEVGVIAILDSRIGKELAATAACAAQLEKDDPARSRYEESEAE